MVVPTRLRIRSSAVRQGFSAFALLVALGVGLSGCYYVVPAPAPPAGSVYVPPQWAWTGSAWVWRPGYWIGSPPPGPPPSGQTPQIPSAPSPSAPAPPPPAPKP